MGKALREAGVAIACVAGRIPGHAAEAAALIGGGVRPVSYREVSDSASHVIVAVSDRAIPSVAEQMAGRNNSLRVAVHTCGSYGPEVLAPLAAAGVSCGALHPLQTLRDPQRGAAALRLATFAVSGKGPALRWAEELGQLLSGRVIHISEKDRPLYHAAAVMASNYVVAMLDAAEQLMVTAGVDPARALPALEALVRETIGNVFEHGSAAALTGPVSRGDAETVTRHLKAMKHLSGSMVDLYRSAGLRALEIARRRGLDASGAARVRTALLGRE
jgi:predicted short-subunit dehydrogenase-like oxidoreductase (DUF2520 family)